MTEIQFNESAAREITAGVRFGSIKTRDGRQARIVCWDAKGYLPIIALIDMGTHETASCFTNEGRHDVRENVTSNMDLVLEVEGGEQ